MGGASRGRATPLATPVDLAASRNATHADVQARLHEAYREPLDRCQAGDQVLRGLPFSLGPPEARHRWLLVDREIEIDLRPAGPATHVLIAHFCDAWRDPGDGRPADLPIGWVTPAGQALARYTLGSTTGPVREQVVRRRFEVNEGIVGWGQGAFAAVPHPVDTPLDWRGPYGALPEGGYAPPGHAGLLGILPGSWGSAQTGVADSVPSPTGDIAFWLYAMEVPDGPAELAWLRMAPLAPLDEGGGIVVAAVTAFRGSASPLAVGPRRTIRIGGPEGTSVGVDLGQVFRTRPAPGSTSDGDGAVIGWGTDRAADRATAAIDVDLAIAPDANIQLGDARMAAADLPAEGKGTRSGGLTIESLRTPSRRIDVEVVDATTGEPVPARVRFTAPDGRYLPPLGHRDEVNPGLNEDTGADLVLGGATYAYVPGTFPIELPEGEVAVEAIRGFGYSPLRQRVDAAALGRAPLRLALDPVDEGRREGWIAVDCHVHFISPTTALLQARAEGIAIVNLLATQWGDHHTSLSDMPVGALADPSGDHIVVMGSENRQNMLGHIGLLGASEPVLPMASAGAPEARLGDPLAWALADWADAARAQDGLAVAVHFPLPYAEIAADIVTGRIDAIELQAMTPGADGPSIREWYRFLGLGYRLPVVGGTDKMSAEVPLGAIRTYARLDAAQPVSFEAWAAAVRAGRTFVSSGSFIDLRVDGCEPGDVIRFGRAGGTVEVRARATAAQPVIDCLELVHDGTVVASLSGGGVDRLDLEERVRVTKGGWIAARVTSREQIHSAFATSMGAHSSPVYLDVADRPAFDAEDAAAIGTIIDGARTWVETIAAVRSPSDRRRLADYLASSRAALDALVRERST